MVSEVDAGVRVQPVNPWWAISAGFCATLLGLGLARFAYTPLLPAIIGAHWFAPSLAAYLGAANLAGYLAGALIARPLAARWSTRTALRTGMLLASVTFFASAFPLSFSWFFFWRFLAGLAGGTLVVLAAPTVLPMIAAARRGLAGGIIFMGVGMGIVIAGTVVPLLLQIGLRETWFGLGVLALALTAIAWNNWPAVKVGAAVSKAAPAKVPGRGVLRALYIEYALNAAGWVPHMLFLVDYVARGLGQGLQAGAAYWVLFGIGASAGPVLSGVIADRITFKRALRYAFLLVAAAVLIPVLSTGTVWLTISSVIVGAFCTGTPPLVLGRINELLAAHPEQNDGSHWRTSTVAFALFQAVAAYGMSFLFDHSNNDYLLLFSIGCGAMLLAFVIDVVAGRHPAAAPAR